MRKRIVSKSKRRIIALSVLFFLLLISVIGCELIYYSADETALQYMESDEAVCVTETAYGWLFDGPSEDTAWIFYPGAGVEETAYAPLLHSLAEQGMDVCLMKLPLRMAFFKEDAAEAALQAHDYSRWYIGGHSLGGVIAASYAVEHADAFSGVILLASYPIKQLPDTLTELLLVGSEDHVINRNSLQKARKYAPEHYVEYVMEGGNHAQFGSYGKQLGDGAAEISAEDQVRETVRAILDHLEADPQESEEAA